jgi:hypothetical protein
MLAARVEAKDLTLRHVASAFSTRTDASLTDRIVRSLIENALCPAPSAYDGAEAPAHICVQFERGQPGFQFTNPG